MEELRKQSSRSAGKRQRRDCTQLLMIAALLSLRDLAVRQAQQMEEHADDRGLIKTNHILIYC